jgi:beta-lactamase superfamily II metal-dependent hydrolase
MFGAVPVPKDFSEEENVITTFTSGNGFTQMHIDGINTLDAIGIFDQFENSSILTTYSNFELGKMTAATYLVGTQYVYYVTHYNGALRINATSYKNAYLPENVNEPNFEKVCDTKGYMLGISSDDGNTQNGMCFVYLLADGTFFVYDGGRSALDSAHLYNFMKKLATQNDIDEIVISAIHITHAHGDHMGYYESFMTQFVQTGKVTLKELWLNQSVGDLGGAGNISSEKPLIAETQIASPNTKIVQPMTGQSFYLADMKVDIIHTMADHDKDMCFADGDANAASTMTRLTVNDWSVLMTGDAYCDCSDLVASMYGEELQVDILQVPHHGVWRAENGTVAFYNVVNPTYALFPCGETLYKTSAKQAATSHLLTRVMKDRNTKGVYVFVAGHYINEGKERITEINFKNHKITVIVNVGQEG